MKPTSYDPTAARIPRAVRYARFVANWHFYRIFLDTSSDSIVITSPDLDKPGPLMRYANPAFQRMTGYKLSELVGRDPRMLQGRNTDPAQLAKVKPSLLAGRWFEGETVNYRKDGGQYIMGWAIVAITNTSGDVVGWLSVQNDISTDISRGIQAAATRLASKRRGKPE